MLRNTEIALEELVKSRDRLILMAGTGMSRAISGASTSTWMGWLEAGVHFADHNVAEKIDLLIKEKSAPSLISAAEMLKRHLKEKQLYFEWMDATIGALRPAFPAPAKWIGRLMEQDSAVITTNYDLLLEYITGAKPLSYNDRQEILSLLRGGKTDSVIHIHGYYANKPDSTRFDNTIAGAEDYGKLLLDETAQFMQRWFASGPIICIGCGATFEDPNIGPLLRWVTRLDKSITHYALMREGELPELPENVLPVYYGATYSDLPPYLERLANLRLAKTRYSFGYNIKEHALLKKGVFEGSIVNLSFTSQWIPFCGGKDKIKQIMDFSDRDDHFLWAVVSGPAGSGKSRLVLECTNRLPPNWQAIFMEKERRNYNVEFTPRSDTFIAIDYVAGREREISLFMSDMHERFFISPNKLRIVLIERSNDTRTGSWYKRLALSSDTYQWQEIMACILGSGQKMSLVHLGDMEEAASLDLIKHVFDAVSYCSGDKEGEALYILFKSVFPTRFRRPLFLLIMAIGWAENRGAWKGLTGTSQMCDWILDREENRWRSILDRSLPAGTDQDEVYNDWKEIVCYCAINGNLPIYETDKLPQRLQTMLSGLFRLIGGTREDQAYYQRVSRFLCDMLGSSEALENSPYTSNADKIHIEWPDFITEYMFLRFIDRNRERLKAFSDICIGIDEKSSMAFLHKLEQDFPYDKVASQILTQYGVISVVLSPKEADDGKKLPKSLDDEIKNLFTRVAAGDLEARNALIEDNLELVGHVVKRYNLGQDQDDLISTGTIGLIKAVNTFKPDGKARFATYAVQCIENEILMYLRSRRRDSEQVDLYSNIEESNLMQKLVIEDYIFDQVNHNIVLVRINKYINDYLNERERLILNLRYSMSGKSLTQGEVAIQLGVSRSFVARIEKAAIDKLQQAIDNGLL